jgi:hypothetical protein
MKKTLLVSTALVALLTGCVKLNVSSTSYDPDSGIAVTNQFTGSFFFAKTTAERIDVIHKTKTTSKLIGARNASESGDAEMIKALSDALSNAAAAGAKAAVKP